MLLFSYSDVELKPSTEFILIGIPLDNTSTVESRAHLGPEQIRKASLQFGEITESGFNLNQSNLYDLGNIPDLSNTKDKLEEDIEKITNFLKTHLTKKSHRLIVLGGDHFITFPILKNLSTLHESFGLIVFDAHLDQYDVWQEQDVLSHCTVLRRIMELEPLPCRNLLYVGTRDCDNVELEQINTDRIPFIRARDVFNGRITDLLENKLRIWRDDGITQVYVSIDIDVLNPGIAPGTGYRMPGGISFWDLWNGLDYISRNFNMIGFDVVEVDPILDLNSLTSIHAAKIVMEIIGLIKTQHRRDRE